MIRKEEIQAEQRQLLDRIIEYYKIDLTGIARESKVVQTTITRFYNNKNSKNALSSVTISKIKARFPLKEEKSQSLSDAEIALASMLKAIVLLLVRKNYITRIELNDIASHAEALYGVHKMPNAEKIAEVLHSILIDEALSGPQSITNTLLQLHPAGSA